MLVRAGQTGGLRRPGAGGALEPATAICEVMADDGTMARMPELERFAAAHGIGIVTVADLIAYRAARRCSSVVASRPGCQLPHGEFSVTAYENPSLPIRTWR